MEKRTEEGVSKQPVHNEKPGFHKKILVVGLLVAILAAGFLYLKKEGEPVQKPAKKEVTEQAFKEKTGYDERLRKVIQEENYVQNQGKIAQGYKFDDRYYLTVNQSGVFTYNKDFPGDILLWVKEENGKVETTMLNAGDKLLNVVLFDGTPYFEQNGKNYILFYEKEGNEKVGYVSKGYVYVIEKNGKMTKQYETKGHFHEAKKEKGQLILVEKVFTDSLSPQPMEWKAYSLKSYALVNGEWTLVNEKPVHPSKKTE